MRRLCLISGLFLVGLPLYAGSQSEPITPSVNWKTYSNDKYGFQFKYPPSFEARADYKLKSTSLFSKKINAALFSVTLLDHGEYAGYSVIVEKKDGLFFHSKALTGFYKYDATLNTWLGYNPVSTEYGHPGKVYFYLGAPLCAQEEVLGPDKLPAYGTTALVSKDEPHNDIVLTDQGYGIEIPREDTNLPNPVNEPLMQTLDKIRDTFQLIEPAKVQKADCTAAVLNVATLQLPGILEPAMGQNVDGQKPLLFRLERKLLPSIGAVVYLTATETADVDKIVFEVPVGDLASGDRVQLNCKEVPLTPGTAGGSPMSLHVLFYKVVNGRKVLLGQDFHRIISLLVK